MTSVILNTIETKQGHAVFGNRYWGRTLLYALFWGLLIAASVLFPLIQHGHRQTSDLQLIFIICFLGAGLAVVSTRMVTAWLFSHRPPITRYSATLLLLATLTVGLIAAMFAIQFRAYFAQWHDPFPSIGWALQFFFTVAYAVYLFASSTLHQIVSPLNVLILLICAWLFEPKR